MTPLQSSNNRIDIVHAATPGAAAGTDQGGPETGVGGEFLVRGQTRMRRAGVQFVLGTPRFPKACGVTDQID